MSKTYDPDKITEIASTPEWGEGFSRPGLASRPFAQASQPPLTRLLQPRPVAQGARGLLVRRVGGAVVVVMVESVRAATGCPGVRGICQGSAAVGGSRRRKDTAVVRGLLRRWRRQRMQGLERIWRSQGGRVLLRLRGLGLLVRRRRGTQPEVQKSRFRRVRRSQQALGQRIHRHHQKVCGTFRGRTRRTPRRRRRHRLIHGPGHYRVSSDRRQRPLPMLQLPDSFMLEQRRLLSLGVKQREAPTSTLPPAAAATPPPPRALPSLASKQRRPLLAFSLKLPPSALFSPRRVPQERRKTTEGTLLPHPSRLAPFSFHLRARPLPPPIGPPAA